MDYGYRLPSGLVEEIPVPPKGFDPLTASAAQLTEYGYPAKPQNLEQLAIWTVQAPKLRGATPPPFLVQGRTQHTVDYSQNYAGYEIDGSANEFNEVTTNYIEPTIYASCSNSSVATWAGIYSYSTPSVLGQDGTEWDSFSNENGMQRYMWSEVINNKNKDLMNTDYQDTVNPGDTIVADVDWSASSHMPYVQRKYLGPDLDRRRILDAAERYRLSHRLGCVCDHRAAVHP